MMDSEASEGGHVPDVPVSESVSRRSTSSSRRLLNREQDACSAEDDFAKEELNEEIL